MFGIGPQELLLIGLLVLVIFGPAKASGMARDLGRFVSGAQRSVEDLKSELYSDEVKEARHTVEEFRDEARRSVEEYKKTEVAGEKEGDKPSRDPRSEEGGVRQLTNRGGGTRSTEARGARPGGFDGLSVIGAAEADTHKGGMSSKATLDGAHLHARAATLRES